MFSVLTCLHVLKRALSVTFVLRQRFRRRLASFRIRRLERRGRYSHSLEGQEEVPELAVERDAGRHPSHSARLLVRQERRL